MAGGGKRDVCEREKERREPLTPSRSVIWILTLESLLSGRRRRPTVVPPPYGSTLAIFTRDPPPTPVDRPNCMQCLIPEQTKQRLAVIISSVLSLGFIPAAPPCCHCASSTASLAEK